MLLLICIDFHVSNFHSSQSGGFAPFGWHGILAALPLGGVVYSLIGGNNVLQLAEETQKPATQYTTCIDRGDYFLCGDLYFGAVCFCGRG